jgi:hypothetical protein
MNNNVRDVKTRSRLGMEKHSHEIVSEAALHHDPVYGTGQIDVSGQEDDVLSLEGGDTLVHLHQVRHHLLERSLPLATGTGTGTRVRTELADLLVVQLLGVKE